MTTKRLQIIVLATLLLDEEEIREDKDYKTQKRSCLAQSWLQWRREKGCYRILLTNF